MTFPTTISDEVKSEIILRKAAGHAIREIATHFNLTYYQVSGIVKRARWKEEGRPSADDKLRVVANQRKSWAERNYLKARNGAREALKAMEGEK